MLDVPLSLNSTFSFAIEYLGDAASENTEWLLSLVEHWHKPPTPFLGPNGEDLSIQWEEFERQWAQMIAKMTDRERRMVRILEIHSPAPILPRRSR